MKWLERNHTWWQTSAYHNPHILSNALTVFLNPLSSTGLASCFTERATVIFNVLQLNGKEKAQSFPSKDREEWFDDPSYQDLRMALSTTTVMNDSAERATALTQQYNVPLTKNEEQKQYLFRIVNHHRKSYQSYSKATLMKVTEDST